MADETKEDIKVETPDVTDVKEEETEELGSEDKEEEVVEEKEEVIDPEKLVIETRAEDEEKVNYEGIDEADLKTVGTIVEKQTAGIKKIVQDTRDRVEVDSYLNEHPEFLKYKAIVLKYIKHPVYNKIPVKNIVAMVASNDLLKIGAEKERAAQKKADATKTPSSTARKDGGQGVDWGKATKEEFEKKKMEVLQSR